MTSLEEKFFVKRVGPGQPNRGSSVLSYRYSDPAVKLVIPLKTFPAADHARVEELAAKLNHAWEAWAKKERRAA